MSWCNTHNVIDPQINVQVENADKPGVNSLLDKLRTLMLGGTDDRAGARRLLERCLRNGGRVTLLSTRNGSRKESMIATIEQVRENDFVIDRPMVGAHVHPLAINEPLHISFICNNGHCSGMTKPIGRYRFSSGSKKTKRVLYGYRMAIPEQLESSNRRRYHRVPLEHGAPMCVALHSSDHAAPIQAVVLDLSAGGMRLQLKDEMMLIDGQEMLLTAEMPPPHGSIAATVEVMRVSQCPRTGRPTIGVRFSEEVANVARYVRQLEIQRGRRAGAA